MADIKPIDTPTEVDHYQLRRTIDVYVMPAKEDLGVVEKQVNNIVKGLRTGKNVIVSVHGAVVGMNESFKRFAIGLVLSVALVYLILMAQFRSFIDPFIILTAIPPGLAGVVMILWMTGSTLNIMSLMGVIMMTGHRRVEQHFDRRILGNSAQERGMGLQEAVIEACKVRLRPILMTSLATLLGLIPLALGTRSGQRTICAAGPRDYRRAWRCRW